MKLAYYFWSLLICLLPMLAIGGNSIFSPFNSSSAIGNDVSLPSSPCGSIESVVLWSGQTINAGSVNVSNDNSNLYVTYSTTGNWRLRKVHLYVGSCNAIPVNNAGNPTIGLFPFSQQFSPLTTSYTFTIPLSSITENCFCIAAHAELVKIGSNGSIVQQETGWGGNSLIGGKSWARKFKYCIQDCPETCDMSVEVENINPSSCTNGAGSVILSASGGVAPYSYTILNTTTGEIYSNTTGEFSNITAGSYLAFVHDVNLCQPDCQNLSFTIDLLPSSLDHTIDVFYGCTPSLGSSITLHPTGSAGPFLYSIGGSFGTSNQFTNISSGTYNTTVMDINGCTSFLEIVILPISPPILAVQSVQHATCSQQNGSIFLSASAGTPGYTFVLTKLFTNQQWSNTSGLFTNLPAGSYTAQIIDANGCVNPQSCSVINVKNLLKNCQPISVCKVDEDNNLIVYPNPASRKVTLYVEQELSSEVTVTVTDQNGKVVFNQLNTQMRTEFELDISGLISGVYYVDVYDIQSDKHLMTRLVVVPD